MIIFGLNLYLPFLVKCNIYSALCLTRSSIFSGIGFGFSHIICCLQMKPISTSLIAILYGTPHNDLFFIMLCLAVTQLVLPCLSESIPFLLYDLSLLFSQ